MLAVNIDSYKISNRFLNIFFLNENSLIQNKLSYGQTGLETKYEMYVAQLTYEQKDLCSMLINVVDNNTVESFLFMDMVELEKHLFGGLYLQVYVPDDIFFLLFH